MDVSADASLRAVVRPEEPRPLDWGKIGVLLAALAHLVAAVWFAASLDRRVTTLEQELPPGAVARIDERVSYQEKALQQIQRSLDRLEARPLEARP